MLITHIKDYFISEEKHSIFDRRKKERKRYTLSIHTYINHRNIKNICSGSTLHTRQHYRRVVCVFFCSLARSSSHYETTSHCRLHIFAFTSRQFFNSMSICSERERKTQRQKRLYISILCTYDDRKRNVSFSFFSLLSLSFFLNNNFNHPLFLHVFTYKLFIIQ